MAKRNGGSPSYRVTSAGVNPAEDRAHRMRMYFIAMTLRLACVLSLFWVSGWWLIIPVTGAIVLPWFAVMVGNAVAYGGEQDVAPPDPLELTSDDAPTVRETDGSDSPELLVVDVEPVRRSGGSGHSNAPSAPSAPGPAPATSGAHPEEAEEQR